MASTHINIEETSPTAIDLDQWRSLVVLVGEDRFGQLHNHWTRLTKKESVEPKENLLLVAGLLMCGKQQPSAITALTAAQSLRSGPLFAGLNQIAAALDSFEDKGTVSPAIQEIVVEALEEAFDKLLAKLSAEEPGQN